jgi:uncharacterized protein
VVAEPVTPDDPWSDGALVGRVLRQSPEAALRSSRLDLAMNTNPVLYFEIPVDDMARAISFYEGLFSVSLERIEIDGNEMALFPFREGAPGASGALAKGDSYTPGAAGARIYFGVEDIDEVLRCAVAFGGRAHYPVTQVAGIGFVAEFIDTEGNCIALHSTSRAGG